MMYQGGKSRYAKRIAALIDGADTDVYIEPFVGGGSVMGAVTRPTVRIASDLHPDLILLHRACASGWVPPHVVTKKRYQRYRKAEPSAMRGFVGFGCSWGAKWMGGYGAEESARRSSNNLRRIHDANPNTIWLNADYRDLHYPAGCVTYLDPPFEGCTPYDRRLGEFDHREFWRFADRLADRCTVFVSERNAPKGWTPALQFQVRGYTNNGKQAGFIETVFTK